VGVIVLGGAAVGLVGRLVGKLGSEWASGLLTGMPEVSVWQPAISQLVARMHARADRAFMSPRLRSK